MSQWIFINSNDRIKIKDQTNVAFQDETFFHNVTISNDGTSLILSAPNDPTSIDKEYLYTDIITPASANLNELTDILNGWKNQAITSHNISYLGNVLKLGETLQQLPTDGILQNIGGDLYWNGTQVTGGGAGPIGTTLARINMTVNQTFPLTLSPNLSWNTISDLTGVGNVTLGSGPTADTITLGQGYIYLLTASLSCNFSAANGQLTVDIIQSPTQSGQTSVAKSLRIRSQANTSNAITINTSSLAVIDCTSTARTVKFAVTGSTSINFVDGSYPDYPYTQIVGIPV